MLLQLACYVFKPRSKLCLQTPNSSFAYLQAQKHPNLWITFSPQEKCRRQSKEGYCHGKIEMYRKIEYRWKSFSYKPATWTIISLLPFSVDHLWRENKAGPPQQSIPEIKYVKLFLHFRAATSEPVVSEPAIRGKIPIEPSFSFLAIFTRGFYKALEEISGAEDVSTLYCARIFVQRKKQYEGHSKRPKIWPKICSMHSCGPWSRIRLKNVVILLQLFFSS